MNATVESIYGDFHAKLRSFTLRRVPDAATADDILQDVYLRIHAHIDELRESERLESWIYQITRNAIADHYRRTRPQDELPESLPAPAAEEPDAEAELAPSVLDMLHCIPPKYRQALELTELQGLTQAELAQHLGISVSGAKSRVQRAREKLREAFLDCCHFEFDRLGGIIAYHPNCPECASEHFADDCRDDESDGG